MFFIGKTGTVSNKDIDTVEVPKICTHDLKCATIRACVYIFGNLIVSLSLMIVQISGYMFLIILQMKGT